MEAIDLVITDIQPGENLTATLTCVEYSREIFGLDRDDFVLPDFVNKVSPVQGAVDHGTINPDSWRLFRTCHDGEDIPPLPSGDGQSDGWHLVQTEGSVWQSSKMARSLAGGDWGAPVKIKGEPGEPGGPGLPGSAYTLIPGASVIYRDAAGAASPSTISCVQRVISGNNPPEESDKTLVYVVSGDSTERPYTGPLTIEPARQWIEFRLRDGDTARPGNRAGPFRRLPVGIL
jgi:hypothetical protein